MADAEETRFIRRAREAMGLMVRTLERVDARLEAGTEELRANARRIDEGTAQLKELRKGAQAHREALRRALDKWGYNEGEPTR